MAARILRAACSVAGRFAALCAAVLWIAGFAARAQQSQSASYGGFEGQKVSEVQIAARADVNLDDVRKFITQRPGEPFSAEAMNASVAALQQSHLFTEVQVSLQPEQDGLQVVFILQPADYVGAIEFTGVGTRFPYSGLQQAVNIPEQTPYVPELLPRAKQGLIEYLHSRGFFAAEVTPEAQRDEAHRIVNLTFRCDLKKQAKIHQIDFTGLTEQQSTETRNALRSLWAKLKGQSLKPGQRYSQARAQKSINMIRSHLREQGSACAFDPSHPSAI